MKVAVFPILTILSCDTPEKYGMVDRQTGWSRESNLWSTTWWKNWRGISMGTVAIGAEMEALHLESDFFKTSLGKLEACVNFHIWIIFYAENDRYNVIFL